MQYLANLISLLRNKENRSNEIISPKIALGKYLANAKFGKCDFFQEPNLVLGKDPLYNIQFAECMCFAVKKEFLLKCLLFVN